MIVIGIGNPTRGDDAVGWVVIDRIDLQPHPDFETARSSGDAAQLIGLWEQHEAVILVDAVRTEDQAGTLQVIDLLSNEIPSKPETSTHGFGVAAAVELSKALNSTPKLLTLVGITAEAFEHGGTLSPQASRAVEEAANEILRISANLPQFPTILPDSR